MEINKVTELIIGSAFEVSNTLGDLCVEDNIVVELKSIKQLTEIHEAQLINYLKATDKKLGLLINFGTPKIQIKRIVKNL